MLLLRCAAFAFVPLLAPVSSEVLAQTPSDASPFVAKVERQLRASYPEGEPGCAVIATKNGKTVFRRAYGLASLELAAKIEPDAAFCIASITKPFTATAIMALLEDGKLALGDAASKHLPDLDLDPRITVEHLLAHTSGLPDFQAVDGFGFDHIHEAIEPAQLCRAASGAKPRFEPGSRHDYCNVNYALLGHIVARVSGQPWREFLAKRVFTPAGMKRTTCGGHRRIVPHAVSAYGKEGGEWLQGRQISYTRGFGLGSMFSTVDDLAAWDRALRAGKILKPATLERMQTPPTLADGKPSRYALGWSLRSQRGIDFVYHGGQIFGWQAMLVRVPKHDVFVAVLTNRDSRDNRVQGLATGLAALVAMSPAGK